MNIYAQITIEDWFDYPKPRDRGWTAIYTLIYDGEYCWKQCEWGTDSFNHHISAILIKSHTDIISKKPGTHFLFKETDLENLCKTE